jgi:Bacterial transglutaminase-like cysteine proteinase BTLCP
MKYLITILLVTLFIAVGYMVLKGSGDSITTPSTRYTESEIKAYITPESPTVGDCLKDILGDPSCQPSQDGFGLIRDWVAYNIDYVPDEEQWGVDDYWQTSEETLSLRTGDCEDFAILLCTLLRAYGISENQLYVALGVDAEGNGHAFLIENWYLDGQWRAIEPQAPAKVLPGRRKFNLVDINLSEYEIFTAFNDICYFDESYPWGE